MKTFLRLVSGVVLIAWSMVALHGCNTVRGVGKDIEKGGEKIQEVTEK